MFELSCDVEEHVERFHELDVDVHPDVAIRVGVDDSDQRLVQRSRHSAVQREDDSDEDERS